MKAKKILVALAILLMPGGLFLFLAYLYFRFNAPKVTERIELTEEEFSKLLEVFKNPVPPIEALQKAFKRHHE